MSDRDASPLPFEGLRHAVDVQLVSASRRRERAIADTDGRSTMARE